MNFTKYYIKNIEETKKRIKESVNSDDFVVQAVNNIDEIKKVCNILVTRLREWYELYNPEFSRELYDNEKFVELVMQGKDKKEKGSMGADFSKEDMGPIIELAKKIDEMYKLKIKQEDYLDKVMKKNYPNMQAVAGTLIGAKILEHTGSLKKLAFMTSSTVQVLGAEKALFRHLKTGARAPKYGIIMMHPFVTKAKNKGKAARILSDKISIAAKVDYFKGNFIGTKLKDELVEK